MPKSCSIDGCDHIHYARGVCKPHYMAQWMRGQHAQAYEQQRRTNPRRREQERQRNRRRRSDINAWLRNRHLQIQRIETVDSLDVFQRDGYRCQICGRKTYGKWPQPTAPTVDHIIPLSRGGDHSYLNVQCACFACNVKKGNRSVNDQLRLIT